LEKVFTCSLSLSLSLCVCVCDTIALETVKMLIKSINELVIQQ